MKSQVIVFVFCLISVIFNGYGQTMFDSIEKDYRLGDFQSVIHKIKNELKTDTVIKNQIYYYGMLGNIYCIEQKLDSALYFIDMAVRLDDHIGYTLATRAEILYSQKKFDQALNDINTAIQLSSENAHYLYLRAILHQNLKKRKLSKIDFEKVKEIAKKENNEGLYNSADKALTEL